MAGLPRDAGEHGWRHADAVKYTILASPQWRWLLNGGTAAGCRRAWLESRRCRKIQFSGLSPMEVAPEWRDCRGMPASMAGGVQML